MKKLYKITLPVLLSAFFYTTTAQPVWTATTAPMQLDRYDDIYFLNPDTGWGISFFIDPVLQPAAVYKTTDGGGTWQKFFDTTEALFRDLGFLDAETGFIGTLASGGRPQDTAILYKTTDGGATWTGLTNLPGPAQAGICGMRVINDSTLYAVGRFFGPAGFYKTTDKGNTWSYTNLSAYAGGLVDIFFFNADTGFVCGTNGNANDSSGIVLYTADAGTTWQVKKVTSRHQELCWKISFPSRNTGYVSIEAFRPSPIDSQHCLKTIDGGQTWQDVFVCQQPGEHTSGYGFDIEGIGFINDTVGWIGGRNDEPGLSPTYCYKTTNGGLTWAPDNFGVNINRFRYLSDTLAYFSGETIYKYANPSNTTVVPTVSNVSQISIYPNPGSTELNIIANQLEQVNIYTEDGKLVADIKQPRNNRIDINGFSPGFYIAEIKTKEQTVNIRWEKM